MLKIEKLAASFLSLIFLGVPFINSYSAVTNNAAPNAELQLLNQAKLLGHADLLKKIDFKIQLTVRNREKFDALYQDIYNPGSARYHKYLTAEEYKTEFAPDTKNLALVKNYFINQGMNATIEGERVNVRATVAQIEQTFHIKMNNYLYQNKKVYSNASPLKIDSVIAPYVLDITGLNNFPRFHKMVLSAPRNENAIINPSSHEINQRALSHLAWDYFRPQAIPTDTSLNGFTGAQLRTTYNLAAIPSVNGTTIDGSGQTIVILDEWGKNDPQTIMEDINKFSTQNNLPLLSMTSTPSAPANFAVTHANGTHYSPNHRDTDEGWSDEIALDLASAHTIAPKANIVLVLNNNLDLNTIITTILSGSDISFAGFRNTYVLSNSWGSDTEYSAPTLELNLQHAAMSGLSVNFSSGDCGDESYNSSWPCTSINVPPAIEYPASSPNVTALGGSSLFVDNNYNYSFETGWGSYYPGTGSGAGFYAGSTGGISQLYSAPAWQMNSTFQNYTAGGYGVISNYGGMRAVPDLAMLADIHTGIIAYYTHGCENGCIFGGTSVACPLYSATLTLINQARMLQNKQTIGLSAQYLYTLNQDLLTSHALHFITPPHQVINTPIPNPPNAPNDAFTLYDNTYWYAKDVTFNWDSSLTMNENQYWNDVVGLGSPNLPIFVPFMASL